MADAEVEAAVLAVNTALQLSGGDAFALAPATTPVYSVGRLGELLSCIACSRPADAAAAVPPPSAELLIAACTVVREIAGRDPDAARALNELQAVRRVVVAWVEGAAAGARGLETAQSLSFTKSLM